MRATLTLYVDYRSPFSYLIKEEAFALVRDFAINLVWRPFTTDFEGAYGGTVGERSERDWRKVRYLYMDARRLADRRGLVIKGPPKIYNPTLAHIGMIVSQQAGEPVFRRYHDTVCERFWQRHLDMEDETAIRAVLIEAGADGAIFDRLVASGEGALRCRAITVEAEKRGVFGVPTFVLDNTGEIFWGTDRVWLLRERLARSLQQLRRSGPHTEDEHGLDNRAAR